MSAPLIISFYTKDWDYPEYAKKLKSDCERLDLDYYVEEKLSTKNYVDNCNIKPFFIKECLCRFQRPVLWIDVDGTINRLPEELLTAENYYDLAGNTNHKFVDRIFVNSLWLNYTSITLRLVDQWCQSVVNFIDDGAFNRSFQNLKDEMKFLTLPDQCHTILNNPRDLIPQDGYFIHRLAASDLKREYKNKVEQK
jgi:hypothetical protein